MKKFLGILVLGLLWCNVGFAEWLKVGKTDDVIAYLEIDRIKSDSNYVYYWEMMDFFERDKYGDLSVQRYIQGDCNIIRFKTLQYVYYDGKMGTGKMESEDSVIKDWKYYRPGAVGEKVLQKACKLK